MAVTRTPTPRGPPVEAVMAVVAEEGVLTSIPFTLLPGGAVQYLMAALALSTRPPARIPGWLPDIVALEEPESHAFPYLVNAIAGEITAARDGVYVVLSTHNPYLLVRLVEKTPRDKLAVYYVKYTREEANSMYIMLSDEHLDMILEEDYASLYTIEDMVEGRG